MSENKKRNRSELSSSSSVSSEIDFKKLKSYLSISSLDSEEENEMTALTEERLQELLFNMKTQIVSEVKNSFKEAISKLEQRVVELENEKTQLNQVVSDLKEQVSNIEEKCKNVENECSKITRENSRVQSEEREANVRSVDNEQYSRKANIKIFGIEDFGEKNENCVEKVLKICKEKMGVELREKDIDVAHRVGKYKENQKHPRGVIVKFLRRKDKFFVLKNGRKLKGFKVAMVEDICVELQLVLNRLKKDPRIKTTWTWDGKMFGSTHDG